MKRIDIITVVLVLAFIAVSIGSVISYQQGYEQGIQYQKAQPVSVTVQALTWELGDRPIEPVTVSSQTDNMARPGTISMDTDSPFIRENDVRLWVVTINP